MNMHTAGVFFPNVYSYSTLTTNSASVSNFNHDVNLFPVTPYWLPSLIPSSIIFSWDCFLFFLFCCSCWWWWCAFNRQSNLGKQVDAPTSGNPLKPIVQLYPILLDSICWIIISTRIEAGCIFFVYLVLLLSFSLRLIMETKIEEECSKNDEIPNHRQVRDSGSSSLWEASSLLIGWQRRAELFNIAFRPLRQNSVISVLSRPGDSWRGEPFKFTRRAPCDASPVARLQQVWRFWLPNPPSQPPSIQLFLTPDWLPRENADWLKQKWLCEADQLG